MRDDKNYKNAKLIAELNATIDNELSKPLEEIDSDLVDECMAFLDDISGDKHNPDENEKQKRLSEISKLISQKYNSKQETTNHRIRWKPIFIAAACIVFLLSSSIFVCAATWKITPGDVLVRWGKAIFDMPYNQEIEESGFTFIFYDDVTEYQTLDEFIESEQLNILLPDWLPEGINIESIIYIKSNGNEIINIQFNNETISYHAKLNQNIDYTEWDIITQGSINDISYYVLESEYGFEVCFNYESNSYSIAYSDIDTIVSIIQNLRL